MKYSLFTFLGLVWNIIIYAQADSIPTSTLKYNNYEYIPSIKTVEFINSDFRLSAPAIQLGATQTLKLSFDDLNGEIENYAVSIIHCTSDWQPSDLMPSEYIEGFSDFTIDDYAHSFNTKQHYIHYNAYIPNESTQFIISGNYLVFVYNNNDKNDLILSRRFVVFNNQIQVIASVNAASIVAERDYLQEVELSIKLADYTINDPYNDLKIVVTQNNNWNNSITGFKPTFVKGEEIVYRSLGDNLFSGGNEYRYFDTKDLRYKSESLKSIDIYGDTNKVELRTDSKRSFLRYTSAQDINGQFLIKNDNVKDSEIGADYCLVTFNLGCNKFYMGTPYVIGGFNNWKCSPTNKMQFNSQKSSYEASIYLKQGYYNYMYALVQNTTDKVIDVAAIEGDHSATENEYTIYVYHKPNGIFYDKLIGYTTINTRQ